MPQATSISIGKFTKAVQAAVKSAVAKHPKFKLEAPNTLSVSYLIRGFPVPEAIAAAVSVGEIQAFADEVAAHLAANQTEALAAAPAGAKPEGAFISVGRHIICGIPPANMVMQVHE